MSRGLRLAAARARRLLPPLLLLCCLPVALPAGFPVCEDLDGDGFWRPARCGTAPDCNDDDPGSHPGARESCDGADNDCNGLIDDAPLCDTT